MRKRRKSRDKIDKSQIDMMQPLIITDINIFGGPDDPCFGKLYSLDAKECNRCGDNEICAIVTAQLNKARRKKLESKSAFKDIEEVDNEVESFMKNLIVTNNITDADKIIERVCKKFMFEKEDAYAKVKKIAMGSKHFKVIKEDGKRYIKPRKVSA